MWGPIREFSCAYQRQKKLASYLRRGRYLAGVSIEKLKEDWIARYREWGRQEGGNGAPKVQANPAQMMCEKDPSFPISTIQGLTREIRKQLGSGNRRGARIVDHFVGVSMGKHS